jgi:hypothetical protein
MIFKKVISRGTMIKWKIIQLNAALIIITEVKVMLIPSAVSIFLETPKNIHRPRNLVKTKLLIKDAAMIISRSFPNSIVSYLSFPWRIVS